MVRLEIFKVVTLDVFEIKDLHSSMVRLEIILTSFSFTISSAFTFQYG